MNDSVFAGIRLLRSATTTDQGFLATICTSENGAIAFASDISSQAATALRRHGLEIGFAGYLSPVLRSCNQAMSGLFGEGTLSGMFVPGLSGGRVRGSSHLWISE